MSMEVKKGKEVKEKRKGCKHLLKVNKQVGLMNVKISG